MQNNTTPPGTIVVGLDGSSGAGDAVRWASAQATVEGRALTLVHSSDISTAFWPGFDVGAYAVEGAESAGRDVLDAVAHSLATDHPGLEVHTVLGLEDPRSLLIELSREAALVVLGSRGRGPVASLVLGSVSAGVALSAHCPTVVLRPRSSTTPTNGVLVGTDGSPSARMAVEFAFRFASERSRPLTVLHCFWDGARSGAEPGPVHEDEEGLDAQWSLVSDSVTGLREKFSDVEVTLTLSRATAEAGLARAGQSMDLVVVGAHQRGGLLHFFDGATDRSVLEHAACAVAVIPCSA